ncbi:hypothetical protein Hanom_Chr08g00700531 [Helianthus anomalus]
MYKKNYTNQTQPLNQKNQSSQRFSSISYICVCVFPSRFTTSLHKRKVGPAMPFPQHKWPAILRDSIQCFQAARNDVSKACGNCRQLQPQP